MNIRRSRWQSLVAAAGVACLALTAAACSSSPTSSSSSAPATTSASAAASPAASATSSAPGIPAGLTGTAKTIATNWVTFFNPKTPVATRVSLLENGPAFTTAIESQSKLAQTEHAAAQVTAVTVTSSTAATVRWNLLVNGSPALANQKGAAVYQGGVWKVSDTSFCSVLKLSYPVPAACTS